MFIIFDLGTLFLLLGIGLVGGAFAGASILEPIVQFLFGPIKFILIILFFFSILCAILSVFAYDSESSLPSKIVGAAFQAVSAVLKNGITVIFLLCILLGFLQNMNSHGLGILWAAFAIISDIIVFALLFSASLCIDAIPFWLSEYIPMFLIGCIIFVLSLLYTIIAQAVLIGVYKSTILTLFDSQPQVAEFLLTPFFTLISNIFGM